MQPFRGANLESHATDIIGSVKFSPENSKVNSSFLLALQPARRNKAMERISWGVVSSLYTFMEKHFINPVYPDEGFIHVCPGCIACPAPVGRLLGPRASSAVVRD